MAMFIAITATWNTDKFIGFFKDLLLTHPNDKLSIFSSLCLLAVFFASIAALLMINRKRKSDSRLPIIPPFIVFVIGIVATTAIFEIIPKVDIPTPNDTIEKLAVGFAAFGCIFIATILTICLSFAAKAIHSRIFNVNLMILQVIDRSIRSRHMALQDSRSFNNSITTIEQVIAKFIELTFRSSIIAPPENKKMYESISTLNELEQFMDKSPLLELHGIRNKLLKILKDLFNTEKKFSHARCILKILNKLEPEVDKWREERKNSPKNLSYNRSHCYMMLCAFDNEINDGKNTDKKNKPILSIQYLGFKIKEAKVSIIKMIAEKGLNIKDINLNTNSGNFETELQTELERLLLKLREKNQPKIEKLLLSNITHLSNVSKYLAKETPSFTLEKVNEEIDLISKMTESYKEIFYHVDKEYNFSDVVIPARTQQRTHQYVIEEYLSASIMLFTDKALTRLSPEAPNAMSQVFQFAYYASNMDVKSFAFPKYASISTLERLNDFVNDIHSIRVPLGTDDILKIGSYILDPTLSKENRNSRANDILKILDKLKPDAEKWLQNNLDNSVKNSGSFRVARLGIILKQISSEINNREEGQKIGKPHISLENLRLKTERALELLREVMIKRYQSQNLKVMDQNSIQRRLKISQSAQEVYNQLSKITKFAWGSSASSNVEAICKEVSSIYECVAAYKVIYINTCGNNIHNYNDSIYLGMTENPKYYQMGVTLLRACNYYAQNALDLISKGEPSKNMSGTNPANTQQNAAVL